MKEHCINDKQRVHGRGLCRRCFNYCAIKVKTGVWTWDNLEAQGAARPKAKRGPKPPAWAQSIQ